MNLPDSIPEWIAASLGGGASVGVGFYAVRYAINTLLGRVDKREAAVEAGFARLDEGTDKLFQRLQGEVNSLADRLGRVEAELEHCREERLRDQEELARLRGLVQGLGEVREQAAIIVAADRVGDAVIRKIGGQG